MKFDFTAFGPDKPDEDYVRWLINEQAISSTLYYQWLWGYYRNELQPFAADNVVADSTGNENSRPYRQVQEYGLPARITGVNRSIYGGLLAGRRVPGLRRKEVVIENDIGWRINTLVDYLFGKPVPITSTAPDPHRRREIEQLISAVFSATGGVAFFQEIALLGSVYGFVDVILRTPADFTPAQMLSTAPRSQEVPAAVRPENSLDFAQRCERARRIDLEAVEAPRAFPILDEDDYRKIRFYIQHFHKRLNRLGRSGGSLFGGGPGAEEVAVTEVLGPSWWQRYEGGQLVAEGPNIVGRVPVVHIQNIAQPSCYEGLSDVEPLIPLQDELNTRQSDRANRVTFQSFKMYLGKGIENFEDRCVAPGRMWSTDNPDAKIEEFGGDSGSPSEDQHILQIRQAMDKVSGVPPIAAGVIGGRIGHLTSAVALRVTLMGLLAKIQRKQLTYGRGIVQLAEMILHLLDVTGIYPNRPEERGIEVHWPSPLPDNITERLQQAKLKRALGVPRQVVLKELGYE